MLDDFLDWTIRGSVFRAFIPVAAVAVVLAIVGAAVLLIVWLTIPKDSKGNPLPCLRSHQETVYIPIQVGKVTTMNPVPMDVCDKYASPSPSPRRWNG